MSQLYLFRVTFLTRRHITAGNLLICIVLMQNKILFKQMNRIVRYTLLT